MRFRTLTRIYFFATGRVISCTAKGLWGINKTYFKATIKLILIWSGLYVRIYTD
jgi:hypothetical protein